MKTLFENKTICCVQDMLKIALDLQKQGRSIYFRGQEYADDKGEELHLLPSIGKTHKFTGEGEYKGFDIMIERNLLHRFCRYAYIESRRALGEWESLFLARHHGLPTRLLDWTANPLIALFFAAQCRELRGDATVWAIVKKDETEVKDIDLLAEECKSETKDDELYYQTRKELPVKDDKKKDLLFGELQKPLRLKGVWILYPFYVSPRMIMQHSFFTIQDDPWCPLDEYHKEHKNLLDKNKAFINLQEIIRWKVPKKARFEIINQLERLGIDNRTIFPDLDGLAEGLWQLEIVRQHNRNPKP